MTWYADTEEQGEAGTRQALLASNLTKHCWQIKKKQQKNKKTKNDTPANSSFAGMMKTNSTQTHMNYMVFIYFFFWMSQLSVVRLRT